MIRSLYAGAAGLKVHQTGLDTVGNNISNVNSVSFKASRVNFGDLMYQNMKGASGATATTSAVSATQIGLGVSAASTKVSIAQQGAAQTTGQILDFRLNDTATTSFFIAQEGAQSHYTRNGNFQIDAGGDLVMAGTGYYIMGWQSVDGAPIDKNAALTKLHIIDSDPTVVDTYGEPTTWARIEGTIDGKDPGLVDAGGAGVEISVYDAEGEEYTARFAFLDDGDGDATTYKLVISGMTDSEGNALPVNLNASALVKFDKDTGRLSSINGAKNTIAEIVAPAALKTATISIDVSNVVLKNAKAKDVEINGSLPKWVIVDDGVASNSNTLGYMAGSVSMGDGDHAATTLDFSAFSAENRDELKNQGFYFTCCTCDQHYSIRFTDGTDISAEASGRHLIYNVGVDDLTTPQQLIDRIMQATAQIPDDEYYQYMSANAGTAGWPQGHFTQLQADGGKLTIYDNRAGVNPSPELGYGSFGLGYATGTKIDLNTNVSALRGDADGQGAGLIKGIRNGYEVDMTGRIFGTYSNGGRKLLGQIATADFVNPTGLESIGNSCYDVTLNSGQARVDTIDEKGGKIVSGQLEMSNVNIADEVAQMIVLQRAFQANSRIITTSDSMLETLEGLKR